MVMTIPTRQYIWTANILILCLIVWSGVNLGMTLLGHGLEQQAKIKAPAAVESAKKPTLGSLRKYDAIVKGNMFSLAKKVKAPVKNDAPTSVQPVVKTKNTRLKLKGTIANQDPTESFAIIEVLKARKQQLFRVGVEMDGITLMEVGHGEVLIKENDEVTKLVLEEPQPASRSGRTRKRPLPRRSSARTSTKPSSAADGFARAMGGNRYIVSRDILNKNFADISSLMSQLNVRPFIKDGKPHGFQISSIKSGSIFNQLGVRNQDVITQLNGVNIRKPDDILGLYRQVQQLDTITMQVERRGRLITFTYSLK